MLNATIELELLCLNLELYGTAGWAQFLTLQLHSFWVNNLPRNDLFISDHYVNNLSKNNLSAKRQVI